MAFYVEGELKGITNNAPYSFNWNTSKQVPDGEYVLVAQAQDVNSHPLTETRLKIWVDNGRRLAKGALAQGT